MIRKIRYELYDESAEAYSKMNSQLAKAGWEERPDGMWEKDLNDALYECKRRV